MLDKYWKEIDTPEPDGFYFSPEWLFQYFNEMPLGEAIESDYPMWKSEQHILTTKYDIKCSLVTLVKHYFCDNVGGWKSIQNYL